MTTKTLSMWGNGAITLPKEWRDEHPTKHFLAKETPAGLLIKPIVDHDDVEYYEDDKGNFGLHFPGGMDMREFIRRWDVAEEGVRKEKVKKKSARVRRK